MQHLEQTVDHHLAAAGVRFTRGRRVTVQVIAEAGGPRTAAEIQAEIGDALPLSSLYRSLSVLTDSGVLVAQHDSGGIMRFELAEWLAGHHHHFVCVSCGTAVDVTPNPEQEHAIERLIEEMASANGFAVTGHRFEIEGRCNSCR
ncbi:MAG: Fur family transcriptional regulator [Acidimicrobiia bacterium]